MRKQTNRSSAKATTARPLIQQVTSALAADPRIDYATLPIQVIDHNGLVGLVGWVPELRDKRRIEGVVADLVGPTNVQSCLVIGPPNQRPDVELVRAVQDSLMEDRSIDSTSIQVACTNGVVGLSGLIDTTLHRRLAAALPWWIPGVREVVDDLSVVYPEPEDDELLVEAIQTVLEKDPLVDRTEILVLSHSGVVALLGTVGGDDARAAAENDAWIVEGVRDVVNQIEVAPGGARLGPIDAL